MDDNMDPSDAAAIAEGAAPEAPKPKTLGQLADELEAARLSRFDVEAQRDRLIAAAKTAALAERDAYQAFNDAVAAVKPKRKSPTPRAEKAPDGEKKPAAEKKASKPKK